MTELMPYRPRAELAVPAASDTDSWTMILAEVATLASQIANTPFVPDGLRGSAPAVAAAILSGRELGLGPMTSLANIHVIKGKPALSAALMRALILAQGHQIETVDISDTRAVIRGRRRGEAEWEEAAFTADQAKRAGIVLGGYPQDKLYARATSRLARRKFADVIAGMPYSAEDLEDGETVDVTTGEITSGAAAIEPARPRTAQRKQRTPSTPPAPSQSPPAPIQAEGAGGALPPLPGEDDEPAPAVHPPAAGAAPDDAPGGERHRKLVGIAQAHFKRLGYNDERREERLVAAAVIAGTGDIESLNDLHPDELSVVADTLAKCRNSDGLKALLIATEREASGGQ